MNSKSHKTFRRTIASAVVRAVLVTAGLVAGYASVAHLMPIDAVSPEHRDTPAAQITTDAARLIAKHDCWTQNGPRGVIPGHVVATREGRTIYGGARLTGMALEQIFDGTNHGLTVHGFCR